MNSKILLLLISGFFLWSCEQPYTPPIYDAEPQIVVEGYLEAGEGANLPYVLITKSLPFLSEIGPEDFQNIFVKNASVVVKSEGNSTVLTQLCLSELPEELKQQAAEILGLDLSQLNANICVYVDLFNQIQAQQGKTYQLEVIAEGKNLSATTTIPNYVGLDSFNWTDIPGEPVDSLAQLLVTINDPVGPNYYRYFTAQNDERLIPPFTSVTDDAFFDGKKFEFPLSKAESPGGDFDPNTFGFYHRGDSVTVKWCAIDKAHFDFWNTRDNGANRGGPFSSYIRVKSNVEGGLGVWGGYAVGVYKLYCPLK